MPLIAADCPRAADLALHIPGVRRLCAVAMARCVTWAWERSLPCVRCRRSCGPARGPVAIKPCCVDDVTAPGLCAAAHPVALCALQGPLQGSGPPPCWREPTSLARCAWGANWTVLMRCAADSALGLSLYGFCEESTAYAVWSVGPSPITAPPWTEGPPTSGRGLAGCL